MFAVDSVEAPPVLGIVVDPGRPPGAVLALECEYLAERSTHLDDGELIDLIVAVERMRRWADGLSARLVAAYADRHPAGSSAPPPGGDVPSPVERWLPDELGLALRRSRLDARAMIAEAQRLAHVLPDTLDALQAGRIDERRADAISAATSTLPGDKAREVEAAVLPKAADATLRQVRDRARRAVHRVDPDGEHRRHRVARQDRRVTVSPREDGMASLWILTDGVQAEASFTMLTRLAHGLGPEDPRTLDQRRSDLANQLLQGRLTLTDVDDLHAAVRFPGSVDCPGTSSSGGGGSAAAGSGSRTDDTGSTDTGSTDTGIAGARLTDTDLVDAVAAALARRPQVHDTARKPLVQVVVGLDTLTGATDRSAELLGHGPITACTAREIAADGVWKRLVTDPLSGALLDHGRTTYRPPPALADHVLARDQTCRNPICTRRARDGDLDHHVRWTDGGRTAEPNLHALCPHDHRLKEHADWHVLAHPDGRLTWVTPAGRRYTSEPFDYRAFTDPMPDGRDGHDGRTGRAPATGAHEPMAPTEAGDAGTSGISWFSAPSPARRDAQVTGTDPGPPPF